MQSSPWLAFVAVFLGGLVTAANPCVLAMIPLTMAYVAGSDTTVSVRRSLGLALCMVLGLSAAFVTLGLIAGLLGGLFGDQNKALATFAIVVCYVMGLHLMEVIEVPLPALGAVQPKHRGPLGAFLLGALFGLVSTPCAGPILILVLTYLATSGSSPAYGAALLLSYALGHSVLILVAGASMGMAKSLLSSERFRRSSMILRRVAGAMVLLVGVYLLTTIV